MSKQTIVPIDGRLGRRDYKIGDMVYVPHATDSIARMPGPCRIIDMDEGGVLVEYFEERQYMHDGNGAGAEHRCWWVNQHDIRPLPVDFSIVTEGTTTYCLRGDKKKLSGQAKFSDTEDAQNLDPLVGAVIAMSRAYGRDPTNVAFKVLKALSSVGLQQVTTEHGKTRLEFQITKLEEQVDKLFDAVGYLGQKLEAKPPEPKPKEKKTVIRFMGQHFGVVGTETKLIDSRGRRLRVGDFVTVSSRRIVNEPSIIVETADDGAFPMGLASAVNKESGAIDPRWTVTKDTSRARPILGKVVVGPVVYSFEEEEV